MYGRQKVWESCRSVWEVFTIPAYEPHVMCLVLINLFWSFAPLTALLWDLSSNRCQSKDLFPANFAMSDNSITCHNLHISMPTCWPAPLALINRRLRCGNSKLTRSLASHWMWHPSGREPIIYALNPLACPLLPLKAFFHALAFLLDISIDYRCLVFQMWYTFLELHQIELSQETLEAEAIFLSYVKCSHNVSLNYLYSYVAVGCNASLSDYKTSWGQWQSGISHLAV